MYLGTYRKSSIYVCVYHDHWVRLLNDIEYAANGHVRFWMCNWYIVCIHLSNHSCALSLLILKFEKHEAHHGWKRFASFLVDNRKRLFAVSCFFVVLSLVVLPQVKPT